jgi:hypothetical protein
MKTLLITTTSSLLLVPLPFLGPLLTLARQAIIFPRWLRLITNM